MKLDLSDEELRQQFSRRIIHIDMDAFFASVEQRDRPELKGRPVIVGGQPDSRGVVAACSYEARKFGVHSAMPCSQAARLCADAIYIKPNIQKYRKVSEKIHQIFSRYTSCIEPLSLDEAYLDVSNLGEPATEIAKSIKDDIQSELNLIASAGVSFNKFLAKLASDMDKPDGLFIIRPRDAQSIVDTLPIRKFHGIGPATEKKMLEMGVRKGEDLRKLEFVELASKFGRSANYYYQIARAIDTRSVKSSRTRKSIGTETTFSEDLSDQNEIEIRLLALAQRVGTALDAKSLLAFTLTLKFKFSNFKQITRSYTSKTPIKFSSKETLVPLIKYLVEQADLNRRSVRLLGVTCSKLVARAKLNERADSAEKGLKRFYQFDLINN